MANPILKEMTVPIPEDGSVVIRNGKRVEYQLERIYSPETKDSRVKRQVIGKVDPVQPGRMFPNEFYFELFPDNEVPEDVREEFLRECAIKRQMHVIRQSPEEIVDNVVKGLSELRVESEEWRVEKNYTMLRRVFDEVYYAVEELAGKYPNEVIVPFKVERINEVLQALRSSIDDNKMTPYLRLIEEGLTYSDVLLLLKWYKVLPR